MAQKTMEPAKVQENEYIPDFISKRPFYLQGSDNDTVYLDHQHQKRESNESSKWYDRGKRKGPAATKFRKGACENCGAMTHKTKECLNRPRAKGAKWTGKGIEADEVIQDVQMGWDAKRDRWNGFDPSEYKSTVEEFEELESLRKKAKRENEIASDVNNIGEEAKYAEESDMGRQQSTSTRNLRLREDTAKYLVNLDLESAKYDPKTRAMVDMGASLDQTAALVAEENFIRASGDAAEFEKAQRYAWEAQDRGKSEVSHLQANPTSGEVFRKRELEERAAKSKEQKIALLTKYGGENYLRSRDDPAAKVMESHAYEEYDEHGLAIKHDQPTEAKSKYSEDVLINNHQSVWGSWWTDFHWGYACCHSTVKNSYCVGEEGRRHVQEPLMGKEEQEEDHRDLTQNTSSASRPLKRNYVEETKKSEAAELEEYKKSKIEASDPMARHLGKDELVC